MQIPQETEHFSQQEVEDFMSQLKALVKQNFPDKEVEDLAESIAEMAVGNRFLLYIKFKDTEVESIMANESFVKGLNALDEEFHYPVHP